MAVRNRLTMIDEFNETTDIFLFLLTTRVGGQSTLTTPSPSS